MQIEVVDDCSNDNNIEEPESRERACVILGKTKT
jgi:hypothetical protein